MSAFFVGIQGLYADTWALYGHRILLLDVLSYVGVSDNYSFSFEEATGYRICLHLDTDRHRDHIQCRVEPSHGNVS